MGKGSNPRPRQVSREEYDRRWDQIDWGERTSERDRMDEKQKELVDRVDALLKSKRFLEAFYERVRTDGPPATDGS